MSAGGFHAITSRSARQFPDRSASDRADDRLLLALPIGWNREKEERSAGLRTFPLVALATCGIVQATEHILEGHPEGTARIIEGLMTGMGFIGGGAILKIENTVRGTATAASLWATGATGAAVGLGAYDVAVVISLFTFLTLWLLAPFKQEAKSK
jgi:putative Mg2+ transporter-C (MgtC) family protein